MNDDKDSQDLIRDSVRFWGVVFAIVVGAVFFIIMYAGIHILEGK